MSFTLTFRRSDGTYSSDVLAGNVDMGTGPSDRTPFSCEHMTTARRCAMLAAVRAEVDVLVERNGRPTLLVHPDGSFDRPPGEKSNCTRNAGTGPCFCPSCRAIRREARG